MKTGPTDHKNKVIPLADLRNDIASLRDFIAKVHSEELPETRNRIQSEINDYQQTLGIIETSLNDREINSADDLADSHGKVKNLRKSFHAFCFQLWGVTPYDLSAKIA